MKQILVVFLLFVGISCTSAQEVYTSSGKPGNHKKAQKKKKGYDPDRLIVGGGFTVGYTEVYANYGLAPIIGYRITDHFSAGIGVGYLYAQQAVTDPYSKDPCYIRQHMWYPNFWARYFVYKNLFVSTTVEQDFISQRKPYDRGGYTTPVRASVSNTCLLVGGGFRIPLGGRISAYGELIYDVLQGAYSPYPKGGPSLRFGFAAGL